MKRWGSDALYGQPRQTRARRVGQILGYVLGTVIAFGILLIVALLIVWAVMTLLGLMGILHVA